MGALLSSDGSEVVQANSASKYGLGCDIDEAVLAATNQRINQEAQLASFLMISVSCENLPNLDTFSKSDAMCVLYQYKK
jgi:hypothetical protein